MLALQISQPLADYRHYIADVPKYWNDLTDRFQGRLRLDLADKACAFAGIRHPDEAVFIPERPKGGDLTFGAVASLRHVPPRIFGFPGGNSTVAAEKRQRSAGQISTETRFPVARQRREARS